MNEYLQALETVERLGKDNRELRRYLRNCIALGDDTKVQEQVKGATHILYLLGLITLDEQELIRKAVEED